MIVVVNSTLSAARDPAMTAAAAAAAAASASMAGYLWR